MSTQLKTLFRMGPRTGLFLLLCANVIMFTQKSIAVEYSWVIGITLLYAASVRFVSGLKWCATFAAVCIFQSCILPIAPRLIVSHGREFMHLTCDCEIRLAKGENPYGRT